jgi:hypothetical protein
VEDCSKQKITLSEWLQIYDESENDLNDTSEYDDCIGDTSDGDDYVGDLINPEEDYSYSTILPPTPPRKNGPIPSTHENDDF